MSQKMFGRNRGKRNERGRKIKVREDERNIYEGKRSEAKGARAGEQG